MILTLIGVAFVLAGVATVLVEAGKNWNRWRGPMRDHNTTEEGKISRAGVIMIGIGMVIALIGTSGLPPPPKPPVPPAAPEAPAP
jgi:hypothetical protein